MRANEIATETIQEVAKIQSKYWQCMAPMAVEQPEGQLICCCSAWNAGRPQLTHGSVTHIGDEPVTTSIPELLKAHRANHLWEKHGMYQIPLASEELEDAFSGQVMCKYVCHFFRRCRQIADGWTSGDLFDKGTTDTLVLFVHDFGNLRVETDGIATTNVKTANSYLVSYLNCLLSVSTSGTAAETYRSTRVTWSFAGSAKRATTSLMSMSSANCPLHMPRCVAVTPLLICLLLICCSRVRR